MCCATGDPLLPAAPPPAPTSAHLAHALCNPCCLPHLQGLGSEGPLPSETGTAVVTEAGQRLTLYSGADGAPGRVQTMGAEVMDTYTILAQTNGCSVTALQIDSVLAGLPPKSAS